MDGFFGALDKKLWDEIVMNTVERYIKENDGMRITYEDRWLVWDEVSKEYVVYQSKRYAKKTLVLGNFSNMSQAMEALVNGKAL